MIVAADTLWPAPCKSWTHTELQPKLHPQQHWIPFYTIRRRRSTQKEKKKKMKTKETKRKKKRKQKTFCEKNQNISPSHWVRFHQIRLHELLRECCYALVAFYEFVRFKWCFSLHMEMLIQFVQRTYARAQIRFAFLWNVYANISAAENVVVNVWVRVRYAVDGWSIHGIFHHSLSPQHFILHLTLSTTNNLPFVGNNFRLFFVFSSWHHLRFSIHSRVDPPFYVASYAKR